MKWNSPGRERRAFAHTGGQLARVGFQKSPKAARLVAAAAFPGWFFSVHQKLTTTFQGQNVNFFTYGRYVFICWVDEEQKTFFQSKIRLFQLEGFFFPLS